MSIFDFLAAGADYQADKAQSKAARALQKYRNSMTRLSDAMNQNAITTNQILSASDFANAGLNIRKGLATSYSSVESSAAAAGVKGRSVTQTMLGVIRSAANREAERQEGFRNSLLAFEQQRQQSAFSAQINQDYSYIPKPQFATYMLKATAKTVGDAMGGGSAMWG